MFYFQLSMEHVQLPTEDNENHDAANPRYLLDYAFCPPIPSRLVITGVCTDVQRDDGRIRFTIAVPTDASNNARAAFKNIAKNLNDFIDNNEHYEEESRRYDFQQWLPKFRRAPNTVIVHGAILRCKLALACRVFQDHTRQWQITEWVLDASRVTRCYQPLDTATLMGIQRKSPIVRHREIIDLTLDDEEAVLPPVPEDAEEPSGGEEPSSGSPGIPGWDEQYTAVVRLLQGAIRTSLPTRDNHIFDYLHCTPLFDDHTPGMLRMSLTHDTSIISIECNHLPELPLGSTADDPLAPGTIVRCSLIFVREAVAVTDATEHQARSWRMAWKLKATQICRCFRSQPYIAAQAEEPQAQTDHNPNADEQGEAERTAESSHEPAPADGNSTQPSRQSSPATEVADDVFHHNVAANAFPLEEDLPVEEVAYMIGGYAAAESESSVSEYD
uniref:Uncharacterized protein n=1 Tax=Mycena chlorophos TaxID=658473 RepID=A0ABQ0KZG0_MYCCL|nr:predicted protein [Mycena chlorophos]